MPEPLAHSFETEASTVAPGKESIFVGIPNMKWVASSLAARMVALERASHDPKSRYRFQFAWVEGAKPCDYARNLLAHLFLKSDASKLWFMDADTMPPKNFTRLLNVKADIVSGITPTWGNTNSGDLCQPGYTIYRYDEAVHGLCHSPAYNDGLEEVDGVGTAMMVIGRHVLEDPRMHLDPGYVTFDGIHQALTPDEPVAIFREVRKPNGQLNMSEDLDFCYRAKRLGYRIVVDHGIKCGHFKEVDVAKVIEYLNVMLVEGGDDPTPEPKAVAEHATVGG